MSDVERLFSQMVDKAMVPIDRDWASRNWRVARDQLDPVGPLPDDGVLDVIGLLLDELEKREAEVKRLRRELSVAVKLLRHDDPSMLAYGWSMERGRMGYWWYGEWAGDTIEAAITEIAAQAAGGEL
jgi:hypothetical protein